MELPWWALENEKCKWFGDVGLSAVAMSGFRAHFRGLSRGATAQKGQPEGHVTGPIRQSLGQQVKRSFNTCFIDASTIEIPSILPQKHRNPFTLLTRHIAVLKMLILKPVASTPHSLSP